MTVVVPVADGVNVTEHVPATRAQLAALNDPAAPVELKLTVPVGVLVVGGEVSATVAVHVEAWLTKTGEVHETVVDVDLVVTVTVVLPELPEWPESPP